MAIRKAVNKPLISVLMPVRNGEKFIAEAIDSVLAQTYQNFELFVIDDASSDETKRIVENYQKLDFRVKSIDLDRQHGAYGAANEAMKQAKGEFIAPMDSDDVCLPERFEKQVEFLLGNEKHIVVGTQALIINEDGIEIRKKVFPTDHREIYKLFIRVHPIVHPSCMIRREFLLDKHKLYKTKYGVNDDYYNLFSLLERGKFANLSEFLLKYRIHGGNSSLKNIKQKFFSTVKIRIEAIKEFRYRPSLAGLFIFALQIAVVSVIPEKALFIAYMFTKGAYSLNSLNIIISKKQIFTSSVKPTETIATVGISQAS